MKRFKVSLIIMMLLVVVMWFIAPALASAATANPSTSSTGYVMIPFQISGQWTATTTSVVKFKIPWPHKLLYVGATARASGGTTPTLTVDVKMAGTSVLSSAMSITAGTITDGTISTSTLTDESTITIDLTIGGTSPTWNDVTVFLAVKRL
jgi:hypothetical protein